MVDLTHAIENRRLVEFIYDGHPRVVIPTAYGIHATTGNSVLRGYQVRGTSKSRTVPLWDLFLIDKMVSPLVLEETFDGEPIGYALNDKHISPIHAQL